MPAHFTQSLPGNRRGGNPFYEGGISLITKPD